MLSCQELKQYTAITHNIDKFFRKLDKCTRKLAAHGQSEVNVLVYRFADYQTPAYYDHHDLIVDNFDMFSESSKAHFMAVVKRRLTQDYGFNEVTWTEINDDTLQLTFSW